MVTISLDKIHQAKQGDKDCFAQIYESVAPDLYKVALYTLGNSHDAEDVVSETFIEAYKGIKNLRDESSFRPWIMKILSIRCKRKIGDYVKGKANMDLDDFVNMASEDGDLAQDCSEKATVMAALDTLTSQERMIVILSVLQGYTTKEIAQILSCPHGTVSSKLHRTLIKLRNRLER